MADYSEANIDNLLVAQKNAIIELIDNDNPWQARVVIGIVRPMWEALDYGYKVSELLTRCNNKITELENPYVS